MYRLNQQHRQFESLVNTEGFQTRDLQRLHRAQFESLVNTEGFQTGITDYPKITRLRVLLIQKDFKLCMQP